MWRMRDGRCRDCAGHASNWRLCAQSVVTLSLTLTLTTQSVATMLRISFTPTPKT
jgi:hypothetical protein